MAQNHIEKITKDELIQNTDKAYDNLLAVLASVPASAMLQPFDGEWNVKDMVAHIVAWEERMHTWATESMEGKIPDRPPEFTDAILDAINAQIYTENKEKPLDEILAGLDSAHQQTISLIKAMSEEDLMDPQRFPWREGSPMWDMFASNSWWHYANTAKPCKPGCKTQTIALKFPLGLAPRQQ